MLFTTLPTTFLQTFCKIFLNFKVIVKSILGPDNNYSCYVCRVKMPKRVDSAKVTSRGIFTGAKVVRGPDWDWGNQDGETHRI